MIIKMNQHILFSYLFLYILSLTWKYVMNCDKSYGGSDGEITSLRYPLSYPSGEYCVNTIILPVGKRIHLKWQTFHVPGDMPRCTGDYVRITRCTDPLKYLIRYCGEFLPNDIYSYDNCIRVEFRSTNDFARTMGVKRFKILYETLDVTKPLISPSNNFSIRKYGDSKNIYTPNWPLSYSGLIPNDGCKTRVTFRNKEKMKILFMGIDLYTPQQSNMLCKVVKNDVLKFDGVTTEGVSYSYNYCGNQKPFAVFYNHYFKYMDIILKPDTIHTHNHKGFVMGIVFFKDILTTPAATTPSSEYVPEHVKEDEDKGLKGSDLVAAIVVPIVVVLIFLCVVREKATKHGGLRALIHKTREDMSGGNVAVLPHQPVTVGAYTLSAPPPYPPPCYEVIPTYGQSQVSVPYSKSLPPPTSVTSAPIAVMPPPYPDSSFMNPSYPDSVTYRTVNEVLPPAYHDGR